MHIVVVGVDHTTAPIALRERLACSLRQIPQVLSAASQAAQECALLSTCNRVELYAVYPELMETSQWRTELLRTLSEARQVPLEEIEAHCYEFVGEQAVAHLFGVSCGLYSLVPGEPQIQGQVVDALELAQGAGYAGPVLSGLFRAAVVTGKRARSETSISRNAASISHVAVQLARSLFPDLRSASILLVGSGQMSELAARNLRDNGAEQVVIINRTHAHAVELAQALGATHRTFSELADALARADVVISSTTAPRAIITTELMQQIMTQRSRQALLLIDIALPRDVEPAVALLPGVHLYNLDDLHGEVEKGIHLRMQEIEHVQAIIEEEVEGYTRWLASLSVTGTISDLRQHVEALRQQELARAMRQLAPTLSEREAAAVQELTTRLVNKVLHTPMLQLKAAAAAGQGHIYAEALRYLFHLSEEEEEHTGLPGHSEGYGKDYDRHAGQQARTHTDTTDCRTSPSALAQP